MTTQNYTNLEFLNKLKSIDIDIPHMVMHLRNNYPDTYVCLVEKVKSLGTNLEDTPISAILYCFEHDLNSIPICQNENCTNQVKWNNKTKQFRKYCCRKCSSSASETILNRKRAVMDKYGVENVFQLESVKQKIQDSCLKSIGVINPSYSDKVKNKRRNTSIEHWGVECPFQSDIIKQKSLNTIKQKYSVCNPMTLDLFKEKRRKTSIEKYGYEYPTQSEEVKKKIVESTNRRFGVDYYSQSSEYHKVAHKPYTNPKYPGMTFGSSWEFKVYDFLIENHIDFEYQPNISFEYEYDGKVHTYHPDFKVGDRIFEIKGDQFFNESGQMINPYDRTEDGKYESKRQCMLDNNVVILRWDDIKQLDLKMFS